MNDKVPELSLVVPVLNEADNVAVLSNEIERAMDGARLQWECVWVDDASTDGTSAALGRAQAADARHRVLRLTRHLGQSAALWVGFQHVRASVLATMDGDGQNDPADLVGMYRELAESRVDMVVGIRASRRDPRLRQRLRPRGLPRSGRAGSRVSRLTASRCSARCGRRT